MNPQNSEFLQRIEPFYKKALMGGTIHMEMSDRKHLQRIIREEWDPNYVACLTCNEGVFDLLKMAFNNFWSLPPVPQDLPQEQGANVPTTETPADVPLTIPVQDPDPEVPQETITEALKTESAIQEASQEPETVPAAGDSSSESPSEELPVIQQDAPTKQTASTKKPVKNENKSKP